MHKDALFVNPQSFDLSVHYLHRIHSAPVCISVRQSISTGCGSNTFIYYHSLENALPQDYSQRYHGQMVSRWDHHLQTAREDT